ncbi:ferritin-like domain-containing protein [Nocardioides sp. cx-169]|uniref:ferritin-like domain-containing protein n=1 Tax=Nocardioides sp. cx-169 TaxID=2899080 RepID=UPI001E4BA54B|nr:ferritin-like domain-containing protein [Nocardioides sp. cx-169]MCD4534617.1 ferritin-like domain-containing protein [Nocardioides sp. cx-169]
MSELSALQTALAAEHAAVYVLGVLGGQTSQSASPRLFAAVTDAYVVHRGLRDQLVRTIEDLGGDPVGAEVSYAVPGDLGTPEGVARRALRLERDCAATYAYLVASTSDELRAWALRALQATAVRELAFGGSPEDFPGRTDG